MIRRRLTIGLVASALLGAALTACAPSPTAEIACAWPIVADRDALNVAYPDAGAVYFTTRYRLAPGQSIELHGTFPFARYTSFITYGVAGSAVDTLTDRDIAPDPGSDNPFAATGASTDPAHRRFTVTIDADAYPGVGGDNRLAPAAAPGSTVSGAVIQRIYVPTSGDPRGDVPLPSMVVRNSDGSTQPIAECAGQAPDPSIVDLINAFGPATDAQPTDPPAFFRPQTVGGLYANPDNVYVAAVTSYQPGRIVVVRGTAPTFPDTRAGASPTVAAQLRYWSMCTNEYRKPYPVTDCASDDQTVLDVSGSYTYVISTPADRPSNATAANGVTWLDWGSTSVNGLLILRNMLPDASFTQSAAAVPPGNPPFPAMGNYAPVARYCTTTAFQDQGGAAACGF